MLNPSLHFGPERIMADRQMRFNPIRSLTPQRLARYLDEFDQGYLSGFALTAWYIKRRDYRIKAVSNKREKAPGRYGWQIVTADTGADAAAAKLAAKQKEVLTQFWNDIRVTSAVDADDVGGFTRLTRHMMTAKSFRYACFETVWKPMPGDKLTCEFRFVPLWFFEARTGRLRFLREPFGVEGVELEPGGWMICVDEDELMIPCSVAYLYKRLSLTDWIAYNGKFGIPGIHGKTNAAKDSREWEEAADALRQFANDWVTLTNEDVSVSLIEAQAKGGDVPFKPLVDAMDAAIAILWRGGDLSTAAKTGPEAVGASLQQDESDILEAEDCAWISDTLNQQIERRVLDYHFGPDAPALAYLKIARPERRNLPVELAVDKHLIAHGAQMRIGDAAERYSRTVENPDDVMTPPQPSSAFDPSRDIVTQRRQYWLQMQRAQEQAANAETRFVTLDDGRVIAIEGDGPVAAHEVRRRMSKHAREKFAANLGSLTHHDTIESVTQAGNADIPGQRTDARLLANGTEDVALALHRAFGPAARRVQDLLAVENEVAFRDALEALLRDFPDINRQVLAEAGVDSAFYGLLSAALVNGLAEGRQNTGEQP